jgi:hypothetical protein
VPGFDEMGTIGSWSYSYTVSATTDFGNGSVPTSGTFTEMGFEDITVTAGTFTGAYHLRHTYTQDWSSIGFGFGGPGLINATADYWYAAGIGLVYEKTVDSGTGATILEKELASYSGLSSP